MKSPYQLDLSKCNFNDLRVVDSSTLSTMTFIQACKYYVVMGTSANVAEALTHPLTKGLIKWKWDRYAAKHFYIKMSLELLFLTLWTCVSLLEPFPVPYVYHFPKYIWRCILWAASLGFLIWEITHELFEIHYARQRHLFLLFLVPIDDFNQIDRYFVSFLCSTYFLFTAILTINIFIGLISNALQTDGFSTVEARFVIERVEVILNYEWRLSKRKRLQRLQIQEMLHRQCAPLQVNWKDINFDAHVHGQPATRTTDTVLHQPSSSTKQAVSKRPSIAHSVISSAHSQEQLAPTSVISLIYEIPSTPHIPQQSNQVLLEEIQKLRELVEKSLQEKRLSTASSTLEAPTVGIMRKSTQPSKQSQSQPPLQSSFVI
ncbi:unnamed protein product [Didymodactylos carnosus]|uniref:Ion transport domain-containing protein n=1 Tax=Didymodactylos carnosus TaxID=1234261 RepID=A0A8S2EMJ6_9BILA|nr:unnamed protein product [Didymodactylos carnosus]CAF4065461.1 unnamed protein product [Didymodactylos carnosus]